MKARNDKRPCMRTLVRAGTQGVLVRIEGGRIGTHFLVSGPGPTDQDAYFDLDLATRSFKSVEQGGRLLPSEADRRSILDQVLRGLPRLADRRSPAAQAPL